MRADLRRIHSLNLVGTRRQSHVVDEEVAGVVHEPVGVRALLNMRIVGYAQGSTEEQAQEGVSLDAQAARLRAWCVLRGLDLVRVFEERGVSGGEPLDDRPAGKALLAEVAAGRVESVVAVKFDRLFRKACQRRTSRWCEHLFGPRRPPRRQSGHPNSHSQLSQCWQPRHRRLGDRDRVRQDLSHSVPIILQSPWFIASFGGGQALLATIGDTCVAQRRSHR